MLRAPETRLTGGCDSQNVSWGCDGERHLSVDCTFPLTVRIVSLTHICTVNQRTGPPAPLPQNSSCQEYLTCADGVQTIFCAVQGGSHCGSHCSYGIAPLALGGLQSYALP